MPVEAKREARAKRRRRSVFMRRRVGFRLHHEGGAGPLGGN
jgi:hypothetical protein